jgi:hypothetical protein
MSQTPSETVSVDELVRQLKGLGELERAECLDDCEQIYGRALADRVRRAVEKVIAQEQGRLVGWSVDNFTGLTESKLDTWGKAYPGVNVRMELEKARAHLMAHPGKIKSGYERFLNSWFKRAMSSSLSRRRSSGQLSQGQMHQMFVQQHEATRICPPAELAQHLARPNVAARYIVDWLFDDWLARWGANFSSRWVGMDVAALKTTWAAELSRLTHQEIKVGVVRARRECHTFAPNWQEFIQFCRPTESIETAFMQAASLAARHQVDHTAVWPSAELYWTAQRFGMAALAQSNWGVAKGRFTNIYHDCLAQKEAGDLPPIPAAVKRIETSVRSPLSDAGSNALAQAKALLAQGRATTTRGAAM